MGSKLDKSGKEPRESRNLKFVENSRNKTKLQNSFEELEESEDESEPIGNPRIVPESQKLPK